MVTGFGSCVRQRPSRASGLYGDAVQVPEHTVPPELALQEPDALVADPNVPWMDMERLESMFVWMENWLFVMGQPGSVLIATPPERVTPPHCQLWKLQAIWGIAVLAAFTVSSNVPKPALAFQTPGLGRMLLLVGLDGALALVDSFEPPPPHAVATITHERTAKGTLILMTASFSRSAAVTGAGQRGCLHAGSAALKNARTALAENMLGMKPRTCRHANTMPALPAPFLAPKSLQQRRLVESVGELRIPGWEVVSHLRALFLCAADFSGMLRTAQNVAGVGRREARGCPAHGYPDRARQTHLAHGS